MAKTIEYCRSRKKRWSSYDSDADFVVRRGAHKRWNMHNIDCQLSTLKALLGGGSHIASKFWLYTGREFNKSIRFLCNRNVTSTFSFFHVKLVC